MKEKKLEMLSQEQSELLYQVLNDTTYELVSQFDLNNKITIIAIEKYVVETLKTLNEYMAQQIVFDDVRKEDNKKTKK